MADSMTQTDNPESLGIVRAWRCQRKSKLSDLQPMNGPKFLFLLQVRVPGVVPAVKLSDID
jgi:hypothetical protein